MSAQKVVMVTGGTGLVGSAIKDVIDAEGNVEEKWVYLSSKDGDLTDPAARARRPRRRPRGACAKTGHKCFVPAAALPGSPRCRAC